MNNRIVKDGKKHLPALQKVSDNDINASDNQWAELFSLSEIFSDFFEGYKISRGKFPKWENEFLAKMMATAKTVKDWNSVALTARKYSPEWREARGRLLAHAQKSSAARHH